MTFFDLRGKKRTLKNARKYLIDWEAKSPSKFQKATKDFLRQFWRGQTVFEELPVVGTRYRIDFYCANKAVAVEAMGKQHDQYTPFFHKSRLDYLSQIKRDEEKRRYCDINDITLVELYETDIKKGHEHLVEYFESLGVIL